MTDETRQPLTVDVILSQAMEKTGTDTPTDLLHAVFDAVDRLALLEAIPTPLLTVAADGLIKVRPDLSPRGLVMIIEQLERIPLAGLK